MFNSLYLELATYFYCFIATVLMKLTLITQFRTANEQQICSPEETEKKNTLLFANKQIFRITFQHS